jgi:hypothetical protein
MRRWNSFISDLLDLSLHATKYKHEVPDLRGGPPDSSIGHKFSDENILRQFQEKWRLSQQYGYSILLMHTRTLPVLLASVVNVS